MRMFRCLMLGSLAVILSGCGLTTPVKMPQMMTYTLNTIQPAKQAMSTHAKATLLVTVPIATPPYDSNQMIYEPVSYDLRSYAAHQWAAPPAQMILPSVAQALRNIASFKAVVTMPYSGQTQYRLDAKLMTFNQNFLQPESRMHIVLQATLTNNMTNEVVSSKHFDIFVSAPGNNPYSGVIAANRAVDILGKQIGRFIKRSL